MDTYAHYIKRDDLPKKHSNYMVECKYCREAFDETNQGSQRHPISRKAPKEPAVIRNVLTQMQKHIQDCPYAQHFISKSEEEEASSAAPSNFIKTPTSRIADSNTSTMMKTTSSCAFRPFLNNPLSRDQRSTFQNLLLDLTVAAAFPFSWIDLPETRAVFEHIRKVRLTELSFASDVNLVTVTECCS